ncbi:MAG: protein-export chaperone SecB [Pseudomonadota bacterium]
MAEQTPGPNTGPLSNGQPGAPTLRAISQFVKDLSFENPANVLPEGQPNIDIGIDVTATPREDGKGVFESNLKLTARAHVADTTLFLLELDYAGLFQVLGLGEQETEAALLIECPRMLFPFARRLVADITREGGFPPLLIDPVDFVQLYRQQKQRQEAAAAHDPAVAVAPIPEDAPVPTPPAAPPPVVETPAATPMEQTPSLAPQMVPDTPPQSPPAEPVQAPTPPAPPKQELS